MGDMQGRRKGGSRDRKEHGREEGKERKLRKWETDGRQPEERRKWGKAN